MTNVTKFVPLPAKKFVAGCEMLAQKLSGLDNLVHELAVTAIYHAQEFGNYAMAGELVTVVFTSKSVRVAALTAFFGKWSNIEVFVGSNGAESRKNRDPKAPACDWEAAYGNPFYLDEEFTETLPKPLTYEDSIQKLFAMSNSIRKTLEGKTARKANDEDIEKLAILADQIREMGQVVKTNVEKAIADAHHEQDAGVVEAQIELDNNTVSEPELVAAAI